jgi:FlaA1/EpsC-like NDP-sugar epimerase
MYDILQGRVSITQLREVRVEDLLQRETVSLEPVAGGSLGT